MNIINQSNKCSKRINLRKILKNNFGFEDDLLDREVRTLSGRLRDFEEMFTYELSKSKKKLKLIERNSITKDYTLTCQGQNILPHLMQIKSSIDAILTVLDEDNDIKRLRISGISSFGTNVIPKMINDYLCINQNVTFDVENVLSMNALKEHEELDSDIALVVKSRNRRMNNPNNMYFITNFNEYPVCIRPKDKRDTYEELPLIKFIEGTSWREKVDTFAGDLGIKTFNPMKTYLKEKPHTYNPRIFVDQNIYYLNKADMMIVNLDDINESPGTQFELCYFGLLKKPIISFGRPYWSPHVNYFIGQHLDSLENALELLVVEFDQNNF
jgi:hypothetical protein